MRHGANSARRVEPLARELAAEIVSVAPWTSRPAFAADIGAWSRAEARCQLLNAYLGEVGLLDPNGVPRPALLALERAESRAATLRQGLGLSPLGLGRLLGVLATAAHGSSETSDELQSVMAEGRRIIEARAAAELPAAPHEPVEPGLDAPETGHPPSEPNSTDLEP